VEENKLAPLLLALDFEPPVGELDVLISNALWEGVIRRVLLVGLSRITSPFLWLCNSATVVIEESSAREEVAITLELLPFWFEPNDGRSDAAIKDDA
jgi:hypothetical protein